METIGQKLKAAREKKGLSPSEVAKAIRVKTEYIVAIEKNEFHQLIAPIYARGFVKLYAESVQLDPAPLLRQFSALENAPAPSSGKPAMPRRQEPAEKKKHAPLKINFTAVTRAWKRIKAINFSRLRLPSMPALPAFEWPDKKWILLIVAVAVCLAVLPVLLKHAASGEPRIKVPRAARWIADPPEPYLEIPARKTPGEQ